MLNGWEKQNPGRVQSIFGAIQNAKPSQLADSQLFDFENLTIDRSGERQEYAYDDAEISASRVAFESQEAVVQFVDVSNV